MKYFLVYFILLFLQTEAHLEDLTIAVETTTVSMGNSSTQTSVSPTTAIDNLNDTSVTNITNVTNASDEATHNSAPDLKVPTLEIDVNTTNDTTTSTIKPTINLQDFYLNATCCDLRNCPKIMNCVNYKDRWGCECLLTPLQIIERKEKANAVLEKMGLNTGDGDD